MITVKLLNHEKQSMFDIQCRAEGRKLFKDVSKDGVIMDPIEVYKSGLLDVTKESESMLAVDFVLSDGGLDRDDERIRTAGWDFSDFVKNPVLLWAHDHSRPAIGTVSDLSKGKEEYGKLSGIANFIQDKSVDHFGWSIGWKVANRIIRSGSVGFKPIEYKFIDVKDDPAWLEFIEQSLWEFSICNVPTNPRALVQDSIIMNPYEEIKTINDKLSELTELLKQEHNNNRQVPNKNVMDLLGEIALSVKSATPGKA